LHWRPKVISKPSDNNFEAPTGICLGSDLAHNQESFVGDWSFPNEGRGTHVFQAYYVLMSSAVNLTVASRDAAEADQKRDPASLVR